MVPRVTVPRVTGVSGVFGGAFSGPVAGCLRRRPIRRS